MTCDVRSNQSDRELARMAAGGDAAAFEEIHSRYRKFVFALALRMTGNEADAEDVTQDSFVSVLRGVGGFRGEAAFTTWLYRLVINQARMHFRRRRAQPEEQAGDGELLERGPRVARRADSDPVIDRLAVEHAVRRLPPGYRAAFLLYVVEGYRHDEIAQLLGCTTGTSKSQLHKAKINLRRMLSVPSPALQA